MATIYNIGKRTWQFEKKGKELVPGGEMELKDSVAKVWVERYPKEFKVIGEEKKKPGRPAKKEEPKKEEIQVEEKDAE